MYIGYQTIHVYHLQCAKVVKGTGISGMTLECKASLKPSRSRWSMKHYIIVDFVKNDKNDNTSQEWTGSEGPEGTR
jgi:hypothetical protein